MGNEFNNGERPPIDTGEFARRMHEDSIREKKFREELTQEELKVQQGEVEKDNK